MECPKGNDKKEIESPQGGESWGRGGNVRGENVAAEL
jgi:hypothetical protein